MAKRNDTASEVTGQELVITRDFNAPRTLVFKVFSEAEHLARWWGPKGSAIKVAGFDFRPGGMFHYSMQYPDGNMMWGKFIYREIISPEKIVFVSGFSDEKGNTIRAPFSNDFPVEILNMLTFAEHNGKTTLTLRGGPINASANEQKFFENMFSSMQQGFKGTFDQLEVYLNTF